MDISVLIPVYNVEKYVIRCLESIANQTKTDNVECIIVDDCGIDNSMKLVREFIENYVGAIVFKVQQHPKNQGLATARNTAMRCASGAYVVMIDSDDYCEPDMLEQYYNTAISTGADIVVSDFWYTYEDHEVYTPQYLSEDKAQQVRDFFSHRLFTVNWNKFIRRTLFTENEITYLDGVNYGEDMKVCFPLFFAAKKIVHVEKAFVHYVQYNTNAYNHDISRKSMEDYIVVLNSVVDCIKKNGFYEQCKDSINSKQLSVKNLLLMHSKGKLQKEWNKLFPDSIRSVKTAQIGKLWKLGLVFASIGLLPVYNLIRYIQVKRSGKKLTIYEI